MLYTPATPIKIHLVSKNGLYTVTAYNELELILETKNLKFSAYAHEYKCLAGGLNNLDVSPFELRKFERTVNPVAFAEKEREFGLRLAAAVKELEKTDDYQPTEEENIQADKDMVAFYKHTKEEQERLEDEYDQMLVDQDHEMMYGEPWAWERPEADETAPGLDYRQMWEEADRELRESKVKELRAIQLLYSDLRNINPDVMAHGVVRKFIVQHSSLHQTRICYDPHQLVDNEHFSLDMLFQQPGWSTVGGGMIMIQKGRIDLFGSSPEYGSFYDDEVHRAANQIFLFHRVVCSPGQNRPEPWVPDPRADGYLHNDDLPF